MSSGSVEDFVFLVPVGIVAALVTLVWARRGGAGREPRRWAWVLFLMQAIYVGFVAFEPSVGALGVELAALGVFAVLAIGAWRGGGVLLPVGYLLHALWDLQHFRAGTGYVPMAYAVLCVAYDGFLMLYFSSRLRAWAAAR